ncbi:MAG TPA: TIM barrel protein [Opitutaceae bacterium]|nr:TIM barrel protein [Opitutaceae bacterium]
MPESTAPSLPFRSRLVSTPAFFPHLTLEPVLELCSGMGFTKFEGFTEWATSRLDWRGDPSGPRRLAESMGLQFSSFHLPTVQGDTDADLGELMVAARYAVGLGARVVLFKAANRELYGSVGLRLLDALQAASLDLTPVLQNYHKGPIDTPDDYRDVVARLANDPRMKALLEVGQFQRSGVTWRQGWELMEGRIALMHINDIREGRSVLYGTGDVDFQGLMRRVKSSGYAGNIVVELELATRETAPEQTVEGVSLAVDHIEKFYNEA